MFVIRPTKGRLPNLIVIGRGKCGTTSLHYYLGLHPQIFMSSEKELNFFMKEGNWHRGVAWYRSNFTGRAKVCGESSVHYTALPAHRGVPERMRDIVPEAKLIYLLKDPIERVVSHYIQAYSDRHEERTLSEALETLDDGNPYLSRSKYFMQLEPYLDYFPKSRILIITSEDLKNRRRQTLKDVFRFLEVDDTFYSEQFAAMKHRSGKKRRKNAIGLFLKRLSKKDAAKVLSSERRRMIGQLVYFPFSSAMERVSLDQALRERLADCLREDIDRLRAHTGYGFEQWSV